MGEPLVETTDGLVSIVRIDRWIHREPTECAAGFGTLEGAWYVASLLAAKSECWASRARFRRRHRASALTGFLSLDGFVSGLARLRWKFGGTMSAFTFASSIIDRPPTPHGLTSCASPGGSLHRITLTTDGSARNSFATSSASCLVHSWTGWRRPTQIAPPQSLRSRTASARSTHGTSTSTRGTCRSTKTQATACATATARRSIAGDHHAGRRRHASVSPTARSRASADVRR